MPRATQLTIRRMECCNTANDRFRFWLGTKRFLRSYFRQLALFTKYFVNLNSNSVYQFCKIIRLSSSIIVIIIFKVTVVGQWLQTVPFRIRNSSVYPDTSSSYSIYTFINYLHLGIRVFFGFLRLKLCGRILFTPRRILNIDRVFSLRYVGHLQRETTQFALR